MCFGDSRPSFSEKFYPSLKMGERKGQNFYYPPDFDPKKHGSLNGYHGVHALRERARKLDRGILIIRCVLKNVSIPIMIFIVQVRDALQHLV